MKKARSVLYLVSTPIGNLGDISLRGLAVLKTADVVVCENAYHSGQLMSLLGILDLPHPKRIETNDKIQRLVFDLLAGLKEKLNRSSKPAFFAFGDYKDTALLVQDVINLMTAKPVRVALISSAGTPLLSDPGWHLVKAAQEKGLEVRPVPGASALLAALVVSGFNLNYFTFLGMLSKKAAARKRLLKDYLDKDRSTTYAAYVSKHQLVSALEDIKSVFGDINVFVANDLTKYNEQGWKSQVSDMIEFLKQRNLKGEFVVVFSTTTKER